MRHGYQAVLLLLGLLFSVTGWTQNWPVKPVRVVVPYPTGGVVDVLARAVTIEMAKELGQPIVVESRSGAGANIGAEVVSKAAPDGYTLLISAPFLLNNHLLDPKLRWQRKDFTAIARYTQSPSFMLITASLPASTVKEYVAYAKARPGIPVAGGVGGSTQTMAVYMFAKVAGFDMNLIDFNGAPAMIPPIMAGDVSMGIIPSSVSLSPLKSGKVRAIANTSDKRSVLLPDVPTIAEAGFPDVTVVSWYGFHAPAGTSRDIIARIAAVTEKATRVEEARVRTINLGGEFAYLGTADFEKFLAEDLKRWERFASVLKKP
jgi:tripartite-type tricarboxylate transporter receptor subunit TctC